MQRINKIAIFLTFSVFTILGSLSTTACTGNSSGFSPDSGVSQDDAKLASDAGVDAGAGAKSIRCGTELCDPASEICVGCVPGGDANLDVHCGAIADGAPYFSQPGSHGICEVGSVELSCDGDEDCSAGESCMVISGEWGHAECKVAKDWPGHRELCSNTEPCTQEGSTCDSDLPLLYFPEFASLLGWQVGICRSQVESVCTGLCRDAPCGGTEFQNPCNVTDCQNDVLDCSSTELEEIAACTISCDYSCLQAIACLTVLQN